MRDLSPEEDVTLRCAVVIPAYNHGSQLGDVLAKALRFGYPVFVVDDGSTDSTREIPKRTRAKEPPFLPGLPVPGPWQTGPSPSMQTDSTTPMTSPLLSMR